MNREIKLITIVMLVLLCFCVFLIACDSASGNPLEKQYSSSSKQNDSLVEVPEKLPEPSPEQLEKAEEGPEDGWGEKIELWLEEFRALEFDQKAELYMDTDWAAAYTEIVHNLMLEYGPGRISEKDILTGVPIVRLVDFDGDSNYELFCAYNSTKGEYWADTQAIYGYEEGRGVYTIMEALRVSWPSNETGPVVELLYKEGKVYLINIFEEAGGHYYTVEDGELVCVLQYNWNFSGQESFTTTLDGVEVSNEELWAAVEKFMEGGILETVYLAGEVPANNKDKDKIEEDNRRELKKTRQVVWQLSGE